MIRNVLKIYKINKNIIKTVDFMLKYLQPFLDET